MEWGHTCWMALGGGGRLMGPGKLKGFDAAVDRLWEVLRGWLLSPSEDLAISSTDRRSFIGWPVDIMFGLGGIEF
jgi:hypothetical protein